MYVLPYGQMSLWGVQILNLLPFQLSTNNYKKFSDKDIFNLIFKFIGLLDGDGYIEIGPQKQYNKNIDDKPK